MISIKCKIFILKSEEIQRKNHERHEKYFYIKQLNHKFVFILLFLNFWKNLYFLKYLISDFHV